MIPRFQISRSWLIAAAVWVVTALAILPAIYHWPAAQPRLSRTQVANGIGYALAVLICWLIYRAESKRLGRPYVLAVAFTVLFLTAVTNNVHSYYVDRVTNFIPYATNEQWQEILQNNVINLNPVVIPHSYRFLPNALVRWLEIRHVSFRAAADLYRLEFGILLFYAIYRFARLYTTFAGGIITMALVAAIYPITLETYAGQLTDPMSHLSFVLAFLFLESDNFPLLLTTLVVGSLAKETVLALAGYYVLFGARTGRFGLKAVTLCAASLISYFGVRQYVLHGAMGYQNISGVDPNHILYNLLQDKRWPAVVLLTAFALLFFLVLSWKDTPRSLKRLYFYLLPVLFLSNLIFSWLVETRNFVPLVIVLAVIAARFCTQPESELLPRTPSV